MHHQLTTTPGIGSRIGRVVRLFAVAAILLAAIGFAAPARHASASYAFVDTDVLNLRETPSTDGAILDRMWQYEEVTILDGPTADGWYLVSYDGEWGWAFGAYLSIDGELGWYEGGTGGYLGSAWVSTDWLVLRDGPSQESGRLDVLPYGEEVTLLDGYENGYQMVEARGFAAWMWAGYLSYSPLGQADASTAERWIDVDRSSETVRLYVGDTVYASYWGAMGFDESADGFYSTAIGSYRVYSLYRPLAWTNWGHAYIRNWVGFDPYRSNGFHSWSLDADGDVIPGGDGPTGGCVALSPEAAAAVYDFAEIGMRVEVHW